MSNQINQREEDKKRLFEKTPDTQPEPIQNVTQEKYEKYEKYERFYNSLPEEKKERLESAIKEFFSILADFDADSFLERSRTLENLVLIEAAKKYTNLETPKILEMAQSPATDKDSLYINALDEYISLNFTQEQKDVIVKTLDKFEPGEEVTPEEVTITFLSFFKNTESYYSYPAKAFLSMSNLLSSHMRKKENQLKALSPDGANIYVGKKGKKEIVTKYYLSRDSISAIDEYERAKKILLEFDFAVYDAVCTLYRSGNKFMTYNQIWRCMNQLTGDELATESTKQDIIKSLEKWESLKTTIKFGDEAKARGKENYIEIQGRRALEYVKIKARINGAESEGILLSTEFGAPALLQYCFISGQFFSFSPDMLNIKRVKGGRLELDKNGKPKSISNSTRKTAITSYLARRRMQMEHNKTLDNTIYFDSIYDAIEEDKSQLSPKQRLAIRDHVYNVLSYWKAIKQIKDFKKVMKGNAENGIQIFIL